MDKQTFLRKAQCKSIDEKNLARIYELYSDDLPTELKQIISNYEGPVFLDDEVRVMSYDEIVDASSDLHVDFKAKGLLPFADTGENDFAVYDYAKRIWALYNIVDDVVFSKSDSPTDLL